MREQIEQLIADLEAKQAEAEKWRNIAMWKGTVQQIQYLSGRLDSTKEQIDRLRAILASPDAVSAEKGADGSL